MPSCRISPAPKTTTATWTLVAGTADGITALQMDIRCQHHHRGDEKALGRHARGGCAFSRRCAKRSRRAAVFRLRAADRHDQDRRQDPRRHRPGRQDDPQHHRAHGVKIDVEDDGRASRQRISLGAKRHHPGTGGDARAQQDLPRKVQRITDFGAFRDHGRHRRPPARVGNRQPSRQGAAKLKEGEQLLVKVITSTHRQDSPEP